MIRLAITFFIIAIIAAIFGFGGIAGDSAYIAKILAIVGLVIAVVAFLFGRGGNRV